MGEEEEEEVQDKEEVPTKCVASTQNFAVKCGVQFIDFEGRTDGESIFKLLQQLRPRRTILVRGSQQSLNSLRDFCSEVLLPFTNQRWCPVFFPGPASSWLFLV